MALSGTPAVFYLSSEGEQALEVRLGKQSSFTALMTSYDDVGAWIAVPRGAGQSEKQAEPVMLLKWDYVATVTFEVLPAQAAARAPIGFHPGLGRPVEGKAEQD
ncbi:MAG TPA: hypothetical protein VMG63_01550 [Terriglobia bacterium]|nr:hypothetical protein [Terriglobia bacterium]